MPTKDFDEDKIKKLYAEDEAYCLQRWMPPRPGAPKPPIVIQGKGAYFWDVRGKRYIDLMSQLYNVHIGMGNREVIEAMKRQLDELPYASPNYLNLPKIELAKTLAKITPGDLCKTFFSNSGTEANEIAIKLAQLYKITPKIIGFWDSYHGSTFATASVGGSALLRQLPGVPIFEDFKHVPSPYCYRCAFGKEYPECDLQCVRFLEYTIEKEKPVAAFMAEPICSWAGQVVPPKEYWPMVRKICDEKEVLLIFDEVMTAFARTGKMFACEHWNIVPDIETYAKGITAGYAPLGATIINKRLGDHFNEKGCPHSYTYSGHALACATALAVIDYYRKENLAERAAEMGNYMADELGGIMERHKVVGDVRGLGLFMGIELVANRKTKESIVPKDLTKEQSRDPEYNPMVYLQETTMDKGLVIGFSPGTCIIRMMPPLIVTKEQVDEGLMILEDVIGALEKKFNLPKEK